MNDRMEHDTYRLWLDLDLEGELAPRESAQLQRHLVTCASCREEQATLGRLQETLAASHVPVREGFREDVMASLPAAGWEGRHPRTWTAAMAVLALLVSAAAFLVAQGDPSGALGPVAGTVAAVLDLFASSMVTGAGLLSASWRGVGLAVQEAVSGSPGGMIVLGVGVVALNVLFFSLLRGTARRLRTARTRDRG